MYAKRTLCVLPLFRKGPSWQYARKSERSTPTTLLAFLNIFLPSGATVERRTLVPDVRPPHARFLRPAGTGKRYQGACYRTTYPPPLEGPALLDCSRLPGIHTLKTFQPSTSGPSSRSERASAKFTAIDYTWWVPSANFMPRNEQEGMGKVDFVKTS